MARGDCNITNICIPTRRIIYSAGFTPPAPPPPVECNFPEGNFSQGGAICDWGYRVRWDIDPAQVPSSQSNYLAFISLDELVGDLSPGDNAIFWNDANRAEFRVTTSDGATEIPHYTSALDTINETGYIWARVPSISSSLTSSLFIYLANPLATEYAVGDPLGRNATFQDFELFADMEQDPAGSSPQLTDLTANGNNYTNIGSWVSGDKIDGKIGSTWDYRVSTYSRRIHNTDPLSFRNDSEGVMSVWVNIDSLAAARQLIGFGGSTASQAPFLQFRAETSGAILVLARDVIGGSVDHVTTATGVVTTGSWFNIKAVSTGAAWQIYVNGVSLGLSVVTGFNSGRWYSVVAPVDPESTIGALKFGIGVLTGMDGKIGPAYIASTVPSADRIATEYNNQNSPGTFATFTNFLANT